MGNALVGGLGVLATVPWGSLSLGIVHQGINLQKFTQT